MRSPNLRSLLFLLPNLIVPSSVLSGRGTESRVAFVYYVESTIVKGLLPFLTGRVGFKVKKSMTNSEDRVDRLSLLSRVV